MAMAKEMTPKEFVGNFVQMLRNRPGGKTPPPGLLDLEKMDPETFDTPPFRALAGSLLQQIPAAGSGLGSCTYRIMNRGPFCLQNVTFDECTNQLHGDFDPGNVCNFPPGPWA
jgi:hypothetical protein